MRKRTVLFFAIIILIGLVFLSGYGESEERRDNSLLRSLEWTPHGKTSQYPNSPDTQYYNRQPPYYNKAPGSTKADSLLSEVGTWGYRSCFTTSVRNNYLYVGTGRMMDILDVSDPATPVKLGSVTLRGLVRSIYVDGNYAYTGESKMGFQVIDVSDPSSPFIVGSLDTPGCARNVYVDGTYAYVADYESYVYEADLRIIDISTPSAPVEVGYLDIPGSANAVHVSGDYAYVAAGSSGLQVVDISTPSSPELIGSLDDIGFSDSVFFDGSYVYMLMDHRSEKPGGLSIIDASTPGLPVEIGSLRYSDISFSGGKIITIDQYAYFTGTTGLNIFDISNPASPQEIGNLDIGGSPGFSISGNYAYVPRWGEGIRVVDVSIPSSPVEIALIDDYTGSRAFEVHVVGGYAYMADDNGGLRIIDTSNPSAPIEVGSAAAPPNGAYGVFVSGNYAYIADNPNRPGLQIMDISNPSSPISVSDLLYSHGCWDVWVSGNHAYMTGAMLSIVDVSTPSSPVEVGQWDTTSYVYGIFVSGNYAYVTTSTNLKVIDITNPAAPFVTGSLAFLRSSLDVYVSGNYAYVSNSGEGLRIIDVSNPSNPVEAGGYSSFPAATASYVQGNYAFVTAYKQGLRVLDVSDPASPVEVDYYMCPDISWGLDVVNGYAYIANGNCGLSIIDVSAYSSYIRVTSPNGGESLGAQSTHDITWSSSGSGNYVKIEYSTDNGINWIEITAETENDGSHPWTIPNIDSSECLVRIGETDGDPSDTSDGVFSIDPIPTIEVTAPNGGETWQVASQQTITWTAIGTAGNVKIEYSTDSGDNWTEITASTENDGSYPWTVPYTVSTQCLVRVGDTGGTPSDTGDGVFSIAAPGTWIPGTEREILIALYNATNGDNWTNNSGWKEPPLFTDGFAMPGTENDWQGITVSNVSGYRVTTISLIGNNLTGPIPPELGGLANLQYLLLYSNGLTGAIPSQLQNLDNVITLYLQSNDLDGTIPPELGSMESLRYLDLSFNELTGGIPSQLQNFGNLINLDLESNNLNGTIPPELGNISSLQTLNLGGNLLSGTIPPQLENLGNLKYLFLYHNDLDGTIPVELGNLNNLEEIDLYSNRLSGGIPLELVNLDKLIRLRLSYNQLTGSIPPELGNFSSIKYLFLDNNDLTGNIPVELSNIGSLEMISLNNNQLNGSIPPELENLVNLRLLLLNNNRLTGNIPPELCNLVNLTNLRLYANQLSGGIPAEVGNLTNLTSLQLNANQLTGSIPSSISNLVNLSAYNTNISYNALYTDDDGLRTFLNSKDENWEATQTTAPTGVSAAVGTTDDSMDITWAPITYTSNNGGYQVFYGTGPGGPYTLFDTTANKTTVSMTVTGLTPGETYYFIIKARTNSHGLNANTVVSDPSEEISAAAGPTITVTSPNGGENLDAGSLHDITWTSGGDINNVIIEYSTDNGSSWQTVVQSTENDGIYNWNVPTTASDNCRVRISGSSSDTGPADTSDAVFSIVSPDPGSITVRSPNGGENRTVGTTEEIKWNSTGDIGYVVIEYSGDNGASWNKIIDSTTNDGSYNWKTPNTVSDKCRVRVTAADGDADPIPSDMSDSAFSILRPTSPTLEVTAPNGGEQLVTGSRCAVTWYTTNSRGEAAIEYSIDNGDSWTEIARVTDNDGEYDWIVPDTPSESCLLRISETGGEPSDVSDAVFSIVSPESDDIVVISPNGGENWEAGSSKEIAWTAAGDIKNVTIEFSTDNGFTWGTVVLTTANDGGYNWTVPDTVSETCRVRVTAGDTAADPKPSDVSDEVFSIALPSTPTIRVTAPNGGERLVSGSRFAVTWFATDSRGEAKIDYSINGGETWTEITGATENDGEYDWTIPDHSSEVCLVRVSEADGQPVDISDAVFIITPPSSTEITVTAPNGGESCTEGSSETIKWTASGDITDVTIGYSTDNGITWEMVAESTANDGIFDWVVPGVSSDTCLVRVTANDDDLDPKPSDVSDEVFSIVSSLPGDFRLTSPNGGESFEVGSTHGVTWSTSGDIGNVMLEYSTDDGVSWSTIVSSVTNGGTYAWSIPNDVSDECRVRVTANDGGGDPRPSDESDSVFSIVFPSSPVIRVLTPNGREQLVIGSMYEVTWFATDSRAEAKIDYSIDGGETWTEITGAVPNNGSYDWLVPDEPSESCLVRVSEVNGEPVDISDAVFSIVSSQTGDLSVLTPNGGEGLEVGSEYNITWECGDLNSVLIEYSVNNGVTWAYIDTVSAGDGNYTWTVPGTPSDSCRVRVSGAESDESPSDVSDGVFSIVDPSLGSLEVITPNGGDSLGVGEEYYITWISSGLDNVLIEYSVDNGESWDTIASVPAIGGRYTWTVPGTPSEGCLIRISGDDSPNDPSDVSDSVFSIVSG